MSIEDELFESRLQRAREMEDAGARPYGQRFDVTHQIPRVLAQFGSKTAEELTPAGQRAPGIRVSGRVMTIRRMGKAAFANLAGGGEHIQIYVRKDAVSPEDFLLFERLDLGDIIGVEGYVFRTRTGELSIHAEKLTFLSKILLALPEKWHGLEDVEMRYRQRYLDLISNPDVRRVFVTRSKVIGSLRRQLDARGFIEVETPMMQPLYGGAAARPFVTHHNTLDVDLFLRIAPELYLKRLVVGGLDRVYEINRNFRNEGISTMHNPEFTMLEFYQAYTDYRGLMDFTAELLARTAEDATGSTRVPWGDEILDFGAVRRLTMREAVVEYWQGDARPTAPQVEDPEWLMRHSGAKSAGEALADLFERFAERRLIQPTFVYDYPVEISPLSMKKPDDPGMVERFEIFAAGMELGNAYTELNDPREQRRRFDLQRAMRAGGDEEAHQMDEDYLRALCYGMPPTAGEGIGIDRLTMILSGVRSIRDVILFPLLRPEGEIGIAERLRAMDREPA